MGLRAGLAIWVSVALTACGGAGPLAGVAPPVAHAGRASGLGEARFKSLDAVYVASVRVAATVRARLASDPSAAERPAYHALLLGACDALDPHDALLGQLRRDCLAGFAVAAAEACPKTARTSPPPPRIRPGENVFSGGIRLCSPAAEGRIRTALVAEVSAGMAADRAVDAAGLGPACRAALRLPPAAYALERAEELVHATVSGDAERRGAAAEARIFGQPQAFPTAKQALERFRGGCA